MTDRSLERWHDAATVAVGVVVGIGLRRWKGDAFESNLRTQLAMQVGLAVGYFLVADQSTDEPDAVE